MTTTLSGDRGATVARLLPRKVRRKTRIGLVAGGLGAYWPQFPDLLPQLKESARYVTGSFLFVAYEGEVIPGPLLKIGNTTSRVDFGCDPGEWVDAWSASGVDHHWALSIGHRSADFKAAANLLGITFREVRV